MFLRFATENNCVAIWQELNISWLKITNCEVAFSNVNFSVNVNVVRLAAIMGTTLNGLNNREWSIGRKRVALGSDAVLGCRGAPRIVDVQLWDSGTVGLPAFLSLSLLVRVNMSLLGAVSWRVS